MQPQRFLFPICVLLFICTLAHAEKSVTTIQTKSRYLYSVISHVSHVSHVARIDTLMMDTDCRFIAVTEFGFLKHGTIKTTITTEVIIAVQPEVCTAFFIHVLLCVRVCSLCAVFEYVCVFVTTC